MDDNKAMCWVGYVNKASVKLRIFVFVTLKTDVNWHTVILLMIQISFPTNTLRDFKTKRTTGKRIKTNLVYINRFSRRTNASSKC